MNPAFQQAAQTARLGWLMGVMTIVFIACFVGWAWWAYSTKNRQAMTEASMLPFTTGDS